MAISNVLENAGLSLSQYQNASTAAQTSANLHFSPAEDVCVICKKD